MCHKTVTLQRHQEYHETCQALQSQSTVRSWGINITIIYYFVCHCIICLDCMTDGGHRSYNIVKNREGRGTGEGGGERVGITIQTGSCSHADRLLARL